MKKMISRFFIMLALVLTTINVCFPSDIDCSGSEYSDSFTSSPIKSSSSNESQEEHHCVCSLSCNSWMTSFSSEKVQSRFVIVSELPFSYELSFYPQISLSMDKPPTV